MSNYRVRYEIDVDAESELEAAREAYSLMVDPSSMLPFLEVCPLDDVRALGAYRDNPPSDFWTGYDLDIMGLGDDVEPDLSLEEILSHE